MIGNNWDKVLESTYRDPRFVTLLDKVNRLYDEKIVYPSRKNIFRAFRLTPYDKVKVVIIGQDPYHGEDEADGLAFSCQKSGYFPPSLKNILKELKRDLGITYTSNSLDGWAKQGVLLLNTILTVEKDKPLSCKNIGWEYFTDNVIKTLDKLDTPIVFMFWGNDAKSKERLLSKKLNQLIIKSSHPSPFSCHISFMGSSCFSRSNKFLIDNGSTPIDWSIS